MRKTSTKFHEGYLMVDHRASPGLPGHPHLGEGTYFETKTMHCAHCGTVVIINPDRTRDRASCFQCNAYICDNCGIEAKQPGYVHESYSERIAKYHKLGELQAYG